MKKLVAVLAAALLGVSVAAVVLWQQLRDEREQDRSVASATEAQDSGVTSSAPLSARPAVAAEEGMPQAAGTQPPNSGSSTPERSNMAAMAQQMLSTPEGREMARSVLRGTLPQQYPDLAKELGLTAEEAEKFFDLLAKHQTDLSADALNMLGGSGMGPAETQELQRKLAEKQQANEAELETMLGSRYPKWQEYQGTAAARQQVDRLKSALSSGSNPLSDAQSKSLIAALGAEQAKFQEEERSRFTPDAARSSTNMLEEQVQRMVDHNKDLVNVADRHLNAEQLAQYRRQLEQETNMAVSMIRMMQGSGDQQGKGN
jgi:hypothetical protein